MSWNNSPWGNYVRRLQWVTLPFKMSDPIARSSLERRFLFVIGSPRSGTSWLHRMIGEHPSVASLEGELTTFNRYVAPLVEAYEAEHGHKERGEWSQGLPLLYPRDEFDMAVRNALGDVYQRVLAQNPSATHILDKHPGYCDHLGMIQRYLPEARFIHIIRDGREVAVSMRSAKSRIGFGARDVESAAREWHRTVDRSKKFGTTVGDRYLEIRYEELQHDTPAILAKVLAHSGLVPDPDHVQRVAHDFHISRKQVSRGDASLNAIRNEPGAIWRDRLSAKQRYQFDRVAGELLQSLGYAEPNWWALGVMDRLRVLPYPFLLKLRRSTKALYRIWSKPAILPADRERG